jgi:multidrug resistance efflux pump
MSPPEKIIRKLLTGLLVLAAIVALGYLYARYVTKPWTRNGQVRARVVGVAPRVSGYIIEVPLVDNQFVRKGDLLFRLDPEPFQLAVNEARVNLQKAWEQEGALRAEVKVAQAEILVWEARLAKAKTDVVRYRNLIGVKAVSQEDYDTAQEEFSVSQGNLEATRAKLEDAKARLGESGEKNSAVRAAKVALAQANLNLSYTKIYALVDGFITNLNIDLGDYVQTGHPVLALVDVNTLRVDAYFQETRLENIKAGDRAVVTLMGYPDHPLKGVVDSIGWAINPPNIADTQDIVPVIQPTFDWVRLPQRVPVRIKLREVPPEVKLVVGLTASVSVFPEDSRK